MTEINEMILKIRSEASFECNAKALIILDVKRLKETAAFLGEDPEGVIKVWS